MWESLGSEADINNVGRASCIGEYNIKVILKTGEGALLNVTT